MIEHIGVPDGGEKGRSGHYRRPRRRTACRVLCDVSTNVLGPALAWLAVIIGWREAVRLRSTPECRMTHSSPRYDAVEISGDGGFAGAWGEYRLLSMGPAGGVGRGACPGPQHQPVLFIPGHMGSYRQARSLDRHALEGVYLGGVVSSEGASKTGGKPLWYYTADFRDEPSALHASMLWRQAAFVNSAVGRILERHSERPGDADVVLIGHSYGGLVARASVVLQGHPPGAVKTIVTLGTPHQRPPWTLDASIGRFYHTLERYWGSENRTSSHNRKSARRRSSSSPSPTTPSAYRLQRRHHNRSSIAHDVTLVSISGGKRDTLVFPSLTRVAGKADAGPVLEVETGGLEGMGFSVDHLALLWCHQLLSRLTHAIHDACAHASATDRLQVFKAHLSPPHTRTFTDAREKGRRSDAFQGECEAIETSTSSPPASYHQLSTEIQSLWRHWRAACLTLMTDNSQPMLSLWVFVALTSLALAALNDNRRDGSSGLQQTEKGTGERGVEGDIGKDGQVMDGGGDSVAPECDGKGDLSRHDHDRSCGHDHKTGGSTSSVGTKSSRRGLRLTHTHTHPHAHAHTHTNHTDVFPGLHALALRIFPRTLVFLFTVLYPAVAVASFVGPQVPGTPAVLPISMMFMASLHKVLLLALHTISAYMKPLRVAIWGAEDKTSFKGRCAWAACLCGMAAIGPLMLLWHDKVKQPLTLAQVFALGELWLLCMLPVLLLATALLPCTPPLHTHMRTYVCVSPRLFLLYLPSLCLLIGQTAQCVDHIVTGTNRPPYTPTHTRFVHTALIVAHLFYTYLRDPSRHPTHTHTDGDTRTPHTPASTPTPHANIQTPTSPLFVETSPSTWDNDAGDIHATAYVPARGVDYGGDGGGGSGCGGGGGGGGGGVSVGGDASTRTWCSSAGSDSGRSEVSDMSSGNSCASGGVNRGFGPQRRRGMAAGGGALLTCRPSHESCPRCFHVEGGPHAEYVETFEKDIIVSADVRLGPGFRVSWCDCSMAGMHPSKYCDFCRCTCHVCSGHPTARRLFVSRRTRTRTQTTQDAHAQATHTQPQVESVCKGARGGWVAVGVAGALIVVAFVAVCVGTEAPYKCLGCLSCAAGVMVSACVWVDVCGARAGGGRKASSSVKSR